MSESSGSSDRRKVEHYLMSQGSDPDKLHRYMVTRAVEILRQNKITEEEGKQMIKDTMGNVRLLRGEASGRDPDRKLLEEARAGAAAKNEPGKKCETGGGSCSLLLL